LAEGLSKLKFFLGNAHNPLPGKKMCKCVLSLKFFSYHRLNMSLVYQKLNHLIVSIVWIKFWSLKL